MATNNYGTGTSRGLADYDRTLSARAVAAVRESLHAASLPYMGRVRFGRDERGPRIDVSLHADLLPAAHAWQSAFGRSYGAVRIFVREAT